jgi:hypothetical protein
MPLQGNASSPQLFDLGRAAGFGFIVAAAFGGGTAGPGQEYMFGTHAVAIHNDIAVQGTNVWPPSPGRQGPTITKWIGTLPQFPEPIAPQVFDTTDLEKTVGNQPLRLVSAAPQSVDLTLQPYIQLPLLNNSNGWTTEYQFGTHQKALYDSQGGSVVFGSLRTPQSAATGLVPLKTIVANPQELSRDLTLQGWAKIPSVAQGWIVTVIQASPQFADFTLQAQFTQAQPFHSAAANAPISPTTIVAVWQQDITQIPAQVSRPPGRVAQFKPIQQVFGAPDRQDYTQPQGQLTLTALPGPSKKLQPAFVYSFEQQYDKTVYPVAFQKAIQVGGIIPVSTGFRVMAVTAGLYQNVYRTPGDVFDILTAGDFSDSSVDYQPPSSNTTGYGWMRKVASNTPLFNWLASNNAPYYPAQDPSRRFIM